MLMFDPDAPRRVSLSAGDKEIVYGAVNYLKANMSHGPSLAEIHLTLMVDLIGRVADATDWYHERTKEVKKDVGPGGAEEGS